MFGLCKVLTNSCSSHTGKWSADWSHLFALLTSMGINLCCFSQTRSLPLNKTAHLSSQKKAFLLNCYWSCEILLWWQTACYMSEPSSGPAEYKPSSPFPAQYSAPHELPKLTHSVKHYQLEISSLVGFLTNKWSHSAKVLIVPDNRLQSRVNIWHVKYTPPASSPILPQCTPVLSSPLPSISPTSD